MFGQDNFGIGGFFQLYEEAFQKEIFEVIHLVPLLGLGFHEPYLDFLKFQVRLFASDHLNKVLDNDVNTIFYTDCFIDSSQLMCWFLYCKETVNEANIDTHLDSMLKHADHIDYLHQHNSGFIAAVEQSLQPFVLYPWQFE
jgi:hypothetical protein